MCQPERERATYLRRRIAEGQAETLAQDLVDLTRLSEDNLNDHFRRLYAIEPPARMAGHWSIAYRLQEKALGGLKPATRRLLASVATEVAVGHEQLAAAR